MWGTSPDVDQKCAIRSYLLTALERSGDLSHNSNVPLVADLNVTIQMRVTIIDRMAGMNKKSCKSCYPVKKAPPQAAKFIEWSDPLISPGGQNRVLSPPAILSLRGTERDEAIC